MPKLFLLSNAFSKRFIITNCLLLWMNYSNSQITKGNWMIGGNGLVSSQSESLQGTNIKGLHMELSPGIGYFFADKMAGGARLGFKYGNIKYSGVTNSTTHLGLGTFLRYYFLNSEKRVNIFAESYYNYSIISGNNLRTTNESLLRFSSGPVIYFNSSVGLEFTINYEFYKSKDANTNAKTVFLGIGFQIHLERDKNK